MKTWMVILVDLFRHTVDVRGIRAPSAREAACQRMGFDSALYISLARVEQAVYDGDQLLSVTNLKDLTGELE
uniref:Uncharacterized protein n=1 Tax=viral metagenome TaxID=1070528 RepID=A0A6M3XP18_9ZZZZ